MKEELHTLTTEPPENSLFLFYSPINTSIHDNFDEMSQTRASDQNQINQAYKPKHTNKQINNPIIYSKPFPDQLILKVMIRKTICNFSFLFGRLLHQAY